MKNFALITSFLLLIGVNQDSIAQNLTISQASGACSGYHQFWALLRQRAGGPYGASDAQFSEQMSRELEKKWGGEAAFKDAFSTALRSLNVAFQNNDGSVPRSYAALCNQIGVPSGKNTK
jgi:hypothetical protein